MLHEGEVPVDERTVHALLREQRPDLAGLPVRRAGSGTDNTMFRVGPDLLVRLPRSPAHVGSLQKELAWLPRFAGRLPCAVPRPVLAGAPGDGFPLPWALLDWIDGEEAAPATVRDWGAYGRDLARVVAALHAVEGMDAARAGVPAGHRGGVLRPLAPDVEASFTELERSGDDGLDLAVLHDRWRQALALPDPTGPPVWLHGDLKPSNVLVRDGRLHAVIDWGGLCRGFPDAEHAPIWDVPAAAREAYREALAIDDATWSRARGWAVAVGLAGLTCYRSSFPAFADECRRRLRAITG